MNKVRSKEVLMCKTINSKSTVLTAIENDDCKGTIKDTIATTRREKTDSIKKDFVATLSMIKVNMYAIMLKQIRK